jgi:hypothetical protein
MRTLDTLDNSDTKPVNFRGFLDAMAAIKLFGSRSPDQTPARSNNSVKIR